MRTWIITSAVIRTHISWRASSRSTVSPSSCPLLTSRITLTCPSSPRTHREGNRPSKSSRSRLSINTTRSISLSRIIIIRMAISPRCRPTSHTRSSCIPICAAIKRPRWISGVLMITGATSSMNKSLSLTLVSCIVKTTNMNSPLFSNLKTL